MAENLYRYLKSIYRNNAVAVRDYRYLCGISNALLGEVHAAATRRKIDRCGCYAGQWLAGVKPLLGDDHENRLCFAVNSLIKVEYRARPWKGKAGSNRFDHGLKFGILCPISFQGTAFQALKATSPFA